MADRYRRGVAGVGWLPMMVVALGSCGDAAAKERNLVDRLRIAVGPYRADSTLGLRLALEPGAAPDAIEPGSASGRLRERTSTWRWDVAGSVSGTHGWRVGGFGVAGAASGSASRLLQLDDRELQFEADASGSLDLDAHSVSYAWWFANSPTVAASAGVGLLRFGLKTQVEGRISVDGDASGSASGSARSAVAGWAPVLRFEYLRRLAPQWTGGIDLAWVRKPSGSLSGQAIDAGVGIEWQPTAHLGLALRYTLIDLDLRYARSGGIAKLGLRTHGPQLLATWRM